jgi:hypothetical protein
MLDGQPPFFICSQIQTTVSLEILKIKFGCSANSRSVTIDGAFVALATFENGEPRLKYLNQAPERTRAGQNGGFPV